LEKRERKQKEQELAAQEAAENTPPEAATS